MTTMNILQVRDTYGLPSTTQLLTDGTCPACGSVTDMRSQDSVIYLADCSNSSCNLKIRGTIDSPEVQWLFMPVYSADISYGVPYYQRRSNPVPTS